MDKDLIKAHLNLYAVLQNFEELVYFDTKMASLTKDWNETVFFNVLWGPQSYISFKEMKCEFGFGKPKRNSIHLFFVTPKHCNAMFDNKSIPIPFKGFTNLGFLIKDFPKLAERLKYYLTPTDELLKDEEYLALNTRFSMNTAMFAVKELAVLDSVGKANAARMKNGVIMMKVLPDGPSAQFIISDGKFKVVKGESEKPTAVMLFKTLKIANDLINGKIDAFTAIASGDVLLKGQIPLLDAFNPILDRVPVYLSV